ncbi:MAG TPA: polysaccharide pyruvyl transferase family protein [Vicinamibacterales bacterium]|nr:polysaccharide pyruvyl transferase family protein [Vicinamibacterales bacterium]
MRIALWNASGLDNLGDRLLDTVNRRELSARLPEASFQTFSPWPSDSLPFVSIDGEGRWCGESEFDAIVIGGGALLIGPPFVHPTLQTCYLGPYPDRFRDACPVVWNAVCSDGQFVPALADVWRKYVQSAAARLTYRSVRNRRTAQLLQECGVTDPVQVVPDPVTLFDQPRGSGKPGARRRRIGLALGASSNADAFVAHLTADSGGLDRNPAVNVSVPPAILQDDDERARAAAFTAHVARSFAELAAHADLEVCAFGAVYGDAATAADVLRVASAHEATLRDADGADALAWIRSLDCLVASRLHACILAVVAGTPLVAIDPYYSAVIGTSKVREFMSDTGLLDEYLTRDSWLEGPISLAEACDRAIAGRDRMPAIHDALARPARAHFDALADVIREKRSS